jgi:hypothetical protein
MSNVELFALGVVVTLLAVAALAPLVWAAIQDGRYNDEQQRIYREQRQAATRHRPTIEVETSRAE